MVAQGDKVGLYLSGQPVPIPDCNIVLTQPKIKDIVIYGEDDFLVGLNLIINIGSMIDKASLEGNLQLDVFSDFQLLMIMIQQDEELEADMEEFLEFLFPDYQIEIGESDISFYVPASEDEEKEDEDEISYYRLGMINLYNFENFQLILSDVLNVSMEDEKFNYNPANEKAAAIAEKLKKGRQRVAQSKGEDGPQSLFGRYASILSIGMQMDINIFFNYTPFQLYDAFQRYFDKVNSDVYTKISTTPLMDVSKLQTPKE